MRLPLRAAAAGTLNPVTWHVTSFYRFLPLEAAAIADLQQDLQKQMKDKEMVGLILLAPEGINGTVAGSREAIETIKRAVEQSFPQTHFKDSQSQLKPFRDIRVEIRDEIVGMKRPDLAPLTDEDHHLNPAEWHAMLQSPEPKLLIDTRNDYEIRLGRFQNAVDPGIPHFSKWPDYAGSADLPKDTPIMIYCTGGIRCEKVMLDLHARGYDKVFQLRDGILGYLAEYPEGFYEGECFVFDDRVALTPTLEPTTTYAICPGCGAPAEDRRECNWCGGEFRVCPACTARITCGKTCADRVQRHGPRPQDSRK